MKRQAARQSGERRAPLASRRGAPSAARRAGRCRQSRGRERGTRPFPAARPNAPSPPPVRTPLPRRPSERPVPAALHPLAPRRNSPSHSPSISLPPHLSLSLPPLPPLPPRPYGRGGSPHGFPHAPRTFSLHCFPRIPPPKKRRPPLKSGGPVPQTTKNGARTPRLHPPPARTPSPLLPVPRQTPPPQHLFAQNAPPPPEKRHEKRALAALLFPPNVCWISLRLLPVMQGGPRWEPPRFP